MSRMEAGANVAWQRWWAWMEVFSSVEVDARGIKVALRFRVAIDNFADPDVDVDFTVGLRVRNGAVDAFYQSFAVDVDWPWW